MGASEPSRAKPRASLPGVSSSKSQPICCSTSAAYALTSTDDAAMGFCSGPSEWIPYSVSMPQTFVVATARP